MKFGIEVKQFQKSEKWEEYFEWFHVENEQLYVESGGEGG